MFLEIKGIKKHFGEGDSRIEVLKGIDMEIEKGELCVLLGPSGSGKSTLLNIIGGIDGADSGYIAINGENSRYGRKDADVVQKKASRLCFSDVQFDSQFKYQGKCRSGCLFK